MARRPSLLFTALCACLLGLIGCSGSQSATDASTEETIDDDLVVATYDDASITLDEFEQAYVNTNSPENRGSDSLSAYKTFLEQYIDYRLKVRAAQDAGLDTLKSIQNEIRSYREQMARPRLMREHVYEPLARSLYDRKQKEVDVSHILTRVDPDAPPSDRAKAYERMQSIADSLDQGLPFAELAYRNSEDPSAQKEGKRGYKGHIGYIRAGQVVKPFEDRMYTVPTDSTSDIFRTRFGYHILKVHDRRPAQPPIRISHIMIRSKGDSAEPRQLLDSLRAEIAGGQASFSALAKEYSEDRRSAARGGDLGTVESVQSLPPSLRQAVSRLDSVGAVSDVVKSRFGYHLVKLTNRETRSSFEESYEDLKNEISDRPRVEQRKERYARQIRTDKGVTIDTTAILQAANVSSIDTISRPLLSIADTKSEGTGPFATMGDSTYTLSQLARHVMQTDGGARMSISEVVNDFLTEKAFTYAGARLAERDSSFAAKMKEYRNGLLVFQFMQDSVWSAAAQDTAGLRQTYRENRSRYRYPDRVRTIALRAPSDSLFQAYPDSSSDSISVQAVVDRGTTDSLVTVDTVMVTDDSPAVYQRVLSKEDGAVAGPVDSDGSTLLLVRDTLLPSRQKTFSEARSSVISDYQDLYEDRILRKLRQRYNATSHPSRLKHAFSDSAASTASSTP